MSQAFINLYLAVKKVNISKTENFLLIFKAFWLFLIFFA